jgi:hypothetical protein
MLGWLRAHLVLVIVFGSALLLGTVESTRPDLQDRDIDQPRVFLDPDVNIADVSAALYPDRALTLYYEAFQASLCQNPAAVPHSACERRGPPKPGEVRELIEHSLATGNRSNELALYNYAMVLIQEGAPASDVAQAVHDWRATYPRSQRPDPRELARAMQRTAKRGGR